MGIEPETGRPGGFMNILLSSLMFLAFMAPGTGPDPASRARQLLFGGQPAQAVPLFEAAVADSTRAEVWLLLSVARQRSGDLTGAVAAADRARSFPSTAARAQARLAILKASQGSSTRPSPSWMS